MKLLNQLKDLVSNNTSKISDGVTKVTSTIDDKTGGKYADKLEKVTSTVEGQLDKLSKEDIDLTDAAVDVTETAEGAVADASEAAAEAAEDLKGN